MTVYSGETTSAVLLHGNICFTIFYKMKFGIFLEFLSLTLFGVQALGIIICVCDAIKLKSEMFRERK